MVTGLDMVTGLGEEKLSNQIWWTPLKIDLVQRGWENTHLGPNPRDGFGIICNSFLSIYLFIYCPALQQ